MFENNSQPTYGTQVQSGVQATFFAKVMFFFALAIFTSALGTYVGAQYLLAYFAANPFLMWGLFAVELVIIFTSRSWSTKTPLNRILFAAFAFITGVSIAPLVSFVLVLPSGAALLTKALIATTLVFAATAIIGRTTKMDLSGLRGFLGVGLISMIITGVLGIFFPWGNTMEIIYSGFGVLLFSLFTMYNFQQLKSYPQDRYIDAALNLYLDIFNLFISILRLMTALSGRE